MSARRALDDGLGVRTIAQDPTGRGLIEVLDVASPLAASEAFESALRARAACCAGLPDGYASVRRIERDGSSLRVIADHVEGLRLPDLLQEAIKSNTPLPLPAQLELASQIVHAVAGLHALGGIFHGAINPAHIVVTRSGSIVLTDCVFGAAIEVLGRNREQLWREFRVAMPSSASLPRFDQRSDVTQLGATVLAVALGRSLRGDEYPRPVTDVVMAATLAARPGETGTAASGLRTWLQQALMLHPRALFASGADAERVFNELFAANASRRAGAAVYQAAIRRIFGETPASAQAAQVAAAWSGATDVHPAAPPFESIPTAADGQPPVSSEARPLSSIFRSVFTNFRAS
jgi:hypothetical protein